jgi:molybdopterin converting factor small subunit
MTETGITILTFGMVASATGTSAIKAPACEHTHALKEWLFNTYPSLKTMKFSIAVDKKVVHNNTPLTAHSEVALLPPYSGG